MNHIRNLTKNLLINGIGSKTNYKLVAFLVDDYGGVRTRDKAALSQLRKAGIAKSSRYLHDTLASKDDLTKLFDILTSTKDSRNNYACFTPLANIANPDFNRIRESNFSEYYREPFTKTLDRYGMPDVIDLWKQGIAENIFHPEYHGTEHINIRSFIKALQNGHKSSMLAFDNESTCCPLLPDEQSKGYSTKTFSIEQASENESLKIDIHTGLAMFNDILGYRPKIFTPGACVYSPSLHQTLAEEGLKYIDVQRYMAYPLGDGNFTKQYLYNGKRTQFGQYYFVRNIAFEPIRDDASHFDECVSFCIKKIEGAFSLNAPAIISSHRANFVSGINPSQGEFGLLKLNELLKEITKRWPDVIFVNGSDLLEILFEKKVV